MKMEDKFKVYDGTEEEKDVEIQKVQEELINEEVNDVKEQSEIEEKESVKEVAEEQTVVKETKETQPKELLQRCSLELRSTSR